LIFPDILRIAKKNDNKYFAKTDDNNFFVKMKGGNENRKWGYQGDKMTHLPRAWQVDLLIL